MTAQRWMVLGLLGAAAAFCAMLHLVSAGIADPVEQRRALGIARMATGLVGIWIFLLGGLMYRFRAAIRARVLAWRWDWRVTFVLFCTGLACLEEVVTVTMTNLAPVFGSRIGEAFITASTNWLDVVAFHSVVVFVPYFIVLALILSRYAFGPFAVFLSFGVVGTVAEAVFAGNAGVLVGFAMWVFVYGLMVWLPVWCLPDRPGARPVGVLGHLVLPFAIFGLALPLIVPLVYVITVVLGHPSIHFAP